MRSNVDFVVESKDRSVQLAVEAKAIQDVTPDSAASIRRNLLAHGVAPPANFFLLVGPEHFYLWKDGRTVASLRPDYTAAAGPILQPRLGDLPLESLNGISLEMIVHSWLDEVVHSPSRAEAAAVSGPWVVESGLYDAIHGGVLRSELSA